LFQWDFLALALRAELLALVGIIIAVTNAPIFQNVGVGDGADPLEKPTVALFYGLMLLAVIPLALAKYCFEKFCPQLVKDGDLDRILSLTPPNSTSNIRARADVVAEWNNEVLRKDGRKLTSILLIVFYLLFLFSLLAGISSLALFGLHRVPSAPLAQQSALQLLCHERDLDQFLAPRSCP
jgi:hypothetical protein